MSDGTPALNELVKRCKDGDEQAWHILLDQVAPMIFSTCKSKQLTREQTFDVFGQVSLQLVTNIGKLQFPAALFSYVRTITRRQIYDLFRKVKQDKAMEAEIENALLADEKSNPDQIYERKEYESILRQALLSLPSRDFELLRALFLEKGEPSYEEIGKRLGMPASSIGPTRARSLEKLYRALKKRKFKF